MKQTNQLTYLDRTTGEERSEPIYAAAFLDWSYNARAGRLLTDHLFNRRWLSRLYGWINRTALSRMRIRPFVEKMEIDCSEIEKPVEDYASFAEFFARRLAPGARPIHEGSDVCIAPADCRALVYPEVDGSSTFRIKGGLFNLETMAADREVAEQYSGGSMFVGRIYLSDYHHFHFPIDGIPGRPRSIPGRYYAVSPYARSKPVPFYSANHRMVTRLASRRFGNVLMIEIGAFTVGSIVQAFDPERPVERGQHKGWFGLGGSTVVLLFERGAVGFDPDLAANSRRKLETYVRMGERIGARRP